MSPVPSAIVHLVMLVPPSRSPSTDNEPEKAPRATAVEVAPVVWVVRVHNESKPSDC
jgi:hypothetical protein